MNKKGQTLGIAIIAGISFFIIGMMSLNFIMDEITTVRLSTGLDCSNTNISDGTKLTCLAIDITIPYLILVILSVIVGLLTERLLI